MITFALPKPRARRIRRHEAGLSFGPVLALMIAASGLAVAAPAWAASGGGHGAYTMEQAKAGKATFEQVCAICHGSQMQGKVGPALKGKQFLSVSQFQGLTAWFLYHFMSTHMPQNDPGSLSKKQYTDLMAFVLNENGYPAGNTALEPTKETLQPIKIEPQTGHSQALELSN